MLADDILSIIIIYTDYDTTLKMLELYPKFNTRNLWKTKCSKLYVNKIRMHSNFIDDIIKRLCCRFIIMLTKLILISLLKYKIFY